MFRFVPTDEEVERGSLERDRFQGIERAIMNAYDYMRRNFPLNEKVQRQTKWMEETEPS